MSDKEIQAILTKIGIPAEDQTGPLLKAVRHALENFKRYDVDKNGTLCLEEFKKIDETRDEAEFVFKLMDLDSDKTISEIEYIKFIAADALGKSYQPYFDRLDKNHDGGIDVTEFKKFLCERGFKEDKVQKLVSTMDTDSSGKVDYKEFRDFLARV